MQNKQTISLQFEIDSNIAKIIIYNSQNQPTLFGHYANRKAVLKVVKYTCKYLLLRI